MASERCGYCGRYMALIDYGADYGTELVCAKWFDHAVADPGHWTVGDLDTAVQVAKARAGLDPEEAHQPELFIEHLDEMWREPFWDRQLGRVIEAEGESE